MQQTVLVIQTMYDISEIAFIFRNKSKQFAQMILE